MCGFIVIIATSFVHFALSEAYSPFFLFPLDVLAIGYLISWLPAYLVAKSSLRKIAASNELLRGTGCAKIGIKAAIVWAILLPIFMVALLSTIRLAVRVGPGVTCGTNLAGVGKALLLYANDHDAYPQPDKWCDALLQGEYADEKIFKCPSNKKAKCSYSMNPNCEPNSEPNTVLVFESRGGWNSYGGPELFTAEHHANEGGNILYNDGHVMFERTDPNGRFYYELNWGQKSQRP